MFLFSVVFCMYQPCSPASLLTFSCSLSGLYASLCFGVIFGAMDICLKCSAVLLLRSFVYFSTSHFSLVFVSVISNGRGLGLSPSHGFPNLMVCETIASVGCNASFKRFTQTRRALLSLSDGSGRLCIKVFFLPFVLFTHFFHNQVFYLFS